MKLIVGLGNPGEKYSFTRHNFGFLAVDELAKKYDGTFSFDKRFNADICEIFVNGEKIILAKPQTFMNNSGEAVREILAYFDISNDRLWLVYDDIDLDLGKVRVRQEGSSGGHKGVQSAIDRVGTNNIARFRMGIKSNLCNELDTEDIVLQKFCVNEEALVKESIKKTLELIEKALSKGIENVSA